MKNRVYLYCPECGKRSQIILDDGADLNIKCGDCLMDRCEVVDMVAGIVRPISEEA